MPGVLSKQEIREVYGQNGFACFSIAHLVFISCSIKYILSDIESAIFLTARMDSETML